MRSLILPIVLVAAGCGGSSSQSFSAAGVTVNVADEGYYITNGNDFCSTGAAGQMKLDFVSYTFICDPNNEPVVPSDGYSELVILLNIGTPPNYGNNYPGAPNSAPYPIEAGDCTNGIGADQAFLYHYPKMGAAPDKTVVATSGSVKISQFDPNKMKPLMGQFDLHFGSTEVKDTFKLDSCN